MIDIENIKRYLPKYLSADSYRELLDGLKSFPNNMDSRFYTDYLEGKIIYQGDGIKDLPTINFGNMNRKDCLSIVLSNTCDMDHENRRMFNSQIVYAPIIELDRYENILKQKGISSHKIKDHIESIKAQELSQILYLPQYGSSFNESLVFMDRIFNIDNDFVNRETLSESRIFSLSDYGAYVFLLKLSIHFTRIQDRVERKSSNLQAVQLSM